MRSSHAALFALALMGSTVLAGPLWAQQVEGQTAGGPDRLALTIYDNDLVLVEDVRSLNIPQGRVKQEFPGVSATIRPETVSLSGQGLSVVEQNFDYDLLTPVRLMEGAVGQTVEIIRTNPGNGSQSREQARVLSANAGVVLQVGDKVEVLRDDRLPTRVVFDGVPPNLRPRPTLSVTLDATGPARRDVTLSYLSRGLGWKADYVARVDEAEGTMDLNGWVTITNRSGSTFTNATTRVVAGQGNRSGSDLDGPIYLLPEPVTVANNQTKQVGLFEAQGVAATNAYRFVLQEFVSMDQARAVETGIRFKADRALPAGAIRFYLKDSAGQPRFIGENHLEHGAAGIERLVKIGDAFDVTVQSRLVAEERVSDRRIDQGRTRYQMEYRVRNASPKAVTVDLYQQAQGRNTEVVAESQPSSLDNAHRVKWQVAVPAGGETLVTATLITGG